MAKQLKLRRGTTSQHSSFTGAEGEVTVDTDKDTLVVHDGSTAGGRPLARADGDITGNAATATTATTATNITATANNSTNETVYPVFVDGATGSQGIETDTGLTYNPSTGVVTATSFTGNVTGNVTGNTSGTAATVTGAAQSAITSTGTLTGLTVSGDVHFDNGADAGKDILWDVSDDTLEFSDNVKAAFGGDSDLLLYHDAGAHSYIRNDTNQLYIMGQNNVYLQHHASGSAVEDMLIAKGDGAVELYYDDSKKFETNSDGIYVTGDISFTGNVYGGDGDKLRLGGDQDLEISHDGSNSIIVNKTGRLIDYVNTNEIAIDRNPNGSVELYHNGTKKFETTSYGASLTGDMLISGSIDMSDNAYVLLGTGDDLQLYHDGSNSYIKNITGGLNISSADGQPIQLIGGANLAETLASFTDNGACELYYDNSKKFETTSSGIEVTNSAKIKGDCTFDNATNAGKDVYWNSSANQWLFYDGVKAMWGNGGDMYLHHDGTDSHIYNGTGVLNIKNDDIRLKTTGDETMLRAIANGAVKVMYDNATKLETVTGGVTVTGTCTATAFAGDGSNLTGVGGRDGTPGFAVGDTDGTTISNTTWTALTWNNEIWDSDNAFASDEFVVPSGEGGKYFVSYSATIDSISNGDTWFCRLYKDSGSGYAAFDRTTSHSPRAGGDGSEPTQSWSGVLDLNAGVKLKVYGRHNQGNNQTIKSTNSHCLATFQAYRIN